MFEAIAVWSTVRLEECGGQLEDWAQKAHTALETFDLGLSMVQREYLKVFSQPLYAIGSGPAAFEDLPDLFVSLRAPLTKAKSLMPKDEPDFNEVSSALKNLQGRVNEELPAMADVLDHAVRFVRDIVQVNSSIRRDARRVVSALEELAWMTLLGTLDQALDGFRIARARRRQGSSFFSAALRLLDAKGALHNKPLRIEGFPEESRYCLVHGDGSSDTDRHYTSHAVLPLLLVI